MGSATFWENSQTTLSVLQEFKLMTSIQGMLIILNKLILSSTYIFGPRLISCWTFLRIISIMWFPSKFCNVPCFQEDHIWRSNGSNITTGCKRKNVQHVAIAFPDFSRLSGVPWNLLHFVWPFRPIQNVHLSLGQPHSTSIIHLANPMTTALLPSHNKYSSQSC